MNRLGSIHDSSLFIKTGGDDIYDVARRDGGLCIDGGAAAGFVTKALLRESQCRVMSFEPFLGNAPHFRKLIGEDARVVFYQAALGQFTGPGTFYVSRVVDGNQPGWEGLPGYSSEGYLVSANFKVTKGKSFEVDVYRLEDLVSEEVTLLKLDLQGGEYDALVGLGAKIELVRYCYVEFSLHWETLDFFHEHGFVVFDTPFTGIPKANAADVRNLFEDPRMINLSNGYQAVSGVVRSLPRDIVGYRQFLEDFKTKYFHHLWTDLIAVNEKHLGRFLQSAIR